MGLKLLDQYLKNPYYVFVLILYAMYLDKPMGDHTLLQALTRVNRPYENEAQNMLKPHGFVLDFVGLFSKLEKALFSHTAEARSNATNGANGDG